MSAAFRYACLVAMGMASSCAVDEGSPGSMPSATASGGAAGGAGTSSGASGSVTEGGHGAFGSDAASTSTDTDASAPAEDAGGSPLDAGALSDAPGSGCITMGTELCDDFEGGHLDPAKWKVNKPTASASITLDGQHVHRGQFAVHIKVVPGTQSTAMITETVTFPAPSNAFYTRMFAYFSPDIPAAPTGDFHTGFVIGSGNNDLGNVQAGVGMIGSAKQFLGYSIFYANPKYEFGPWSATKITPNQWLCVELFENGADPTTEVRQIWVNGTELVDLKSSSAASAAGKQPNHLPPKFDMVSLGLWEYHPIPTLSDMWIDDVRVSSRRIGCEN